MCFYNLAFLASSDIKSRACALLLSQNLVLFLLHFSYSMNAFESINNSIELCVYGNMLGPVYYQVQFSDKFEPLFSP